MEDWAQLLEFADQSESFTLGFEAGRIWEKMKIEPEKLDGQLVHAENTEMILRMAEACSVDLYAQIYDDTWIMLKTERLDPDG